MKTIISAIATMALAGAVTAAAPAVFAADGPTMKKVKARGEVICGVHQGRYGFAIADSQGKWKG